ncbi:alpha-amylase [Schizosaccharomyces cryophilus OY26]|uniref:Alpha-amylase n=1 Tax=Schizosaccharomyces cryophilus (strain OY26 / ATCC MYA-4695 / CBS 11777 / NBRC 106824 / NRRL Y48691) TaxID=653667 RepID=S9VZP5_SCHCR|nr:alpha-amylase [Schizosaccharomyces cryophilus OY26]EPY51305.1 alpha-amylase [Schizosaccharomyces cryophilus OY26]
MACCFYQKQVFIKEKEYNDLWRKQVIYQLLTDRFARDEDDFEHPSQGRKYLGGTWRGIIKKLDYIQSLGCTAVWISPIVKNIESQTGYGEAYHGYWAQDFTELNNHFGSSQDLKDLVNSLHKRGMLCMIDIVVNHMGHAGTQAIDYTQFKPFNQANDFHPWKYIQDYNNQEEVVKGWLGDNCVNLPDIKTEKPSVRKFFKKWISDLINTYKFDGIRIDTAKHVEKSFYPSFIETANVFTTGEIFHGNPKYAGIYQNYMPSIINFPFYYQLREAFSSPRKPMLEYYQKGVLDIRHSFRDTTILCNFLENHDVPRFFSQTQDNALALNALAATIFSDGIPVIYYGQEQRFSGGNDPDNREGLWVSKYDTSNFVFECISLFIRLRQRLVAKYPKFCTQLSQMVYVDNRVYAFYRPGILLVLCNGGRKMRKTIQIDISSFSSHTNQVFVDALTQSRIQATEKILNLTVKYGLPLVCIFMFSQKVF